MSIGDSAAAVPSPTMNPFVKLAVEAGPLAVFFFANGRWGLFAGTGAFMAATVVSLAIGWGLERRVPIMPLVSGFFVITFGGLTLALADETFIKMKPTIVNAIFALILVGGLVSGRALLKRLLGSAFRLTDAAWRTLTIRWSLFFVVMAILNEIVWRNSSTEFWISFKLFGAMPLGLLFAAAQTPLILRARLPDPEDAPEEATPASATSSGDGTPG